MTAIARLTNKKGKEYAYILIQSYNGVEAEIKVNIYNYNAILSIYEANKLATEILRTTRNLTKDIKLRREGRV